MPGKIVQKVVGSIVVLALLTGCLSGCGAAGNTGTGGRPNGSESGGHSSDKDDGAGKRPDGNGTGGLIPDDGAEETSAAASPATAAPAGKTLRRETVTTGYGGDVNVVVTEYLENGLAVRVYSADGSADEAQEISYDYGENGVPIRMRLNLDYGTEAVIEIANHYENERITGARISEIWLNGESCLDAGRMPDTVIFYSYLSAFLRLLQHYEGYKDAEISIRNTENCVRLQNGEVVYSCSDMAGTVKTVTEVTQDSNGHKTISVTTTSSTQISEMDEYGRYVKFGIVAGRQSVTMLIEYEIQAGSDAHRRTEVGHVADIQYDMDTEYPDGQLEEMAAQFSFTYTFADDVLIFSETDLVGTQKTTCEYSADGLLLRQAVETNTGDRIYSIVTEYEYQ